MSSSDSHYDIIIAGGGPAGLTAGLYASRARLKTLLLEKATLGGQIVKSDQIENYPCFEKSVSGFELMHNLEKQAKGFGLQIETGSAQSLATSADGHQKTITAGEKKYHCKALIIATGSEPNTLNLEGEEKLTGRGVSYCATCDGAFFRDKEVAVVGGGDAAVEEALFLARLVKKVHIIHRRDQLRAIKILQERAFANENITFVWDSVVKQIVGDEAVESLLLKNVKTNNESSLKVEAVFIYVGLHPNTEWLK
ncbi:MAG: FAD-dependent oxidoreductase, partial [Thermodesulfobacteriota bacterium]|nr:FAD-dependent oxidoreductase [Thermodesulfobacteriota bacterium]